MREIRLYGEMGRRFGRRFHLDVKSPAEAIRALGAVVPGFRAWLTKQAQDGAKYHVLIGKRDISADELTHPAGDVIRIAPEIRGAKRGGILNVIVGVILIVVGYFCFGATSQIGAAMIAGGIGGVAGGIVQMLSPQPNMDMSGAERPENRPSYAFNGPINTMAQGHPVPVLYGELLVGSAVISAGMVAEDF